MEHFSFRIGTGMPPTTSCTKLFSFPEPLAFRLMCSIEYELRAQNKRGLSVVGLYFFGIEIFLDVIKFSIGANFEIPLLYKVSLNLNVNCLDKSINSKDLLIIR